MAVPGKFEVYRTVMLVAALTVGAIGWFVFDIVTPLGVGDGVGYPVLLTLCLWSDRRGVLVAFALLTTVLTLAAAVIPHPLGGTIEGSILDRATAIASIWGMFFLLWQRLRLEKALKFREREAVIANQAKSQFLANVSHELRTPLNAINGFSEMLTTGYFGELTAKQRECIADILSSGIHMLTLINQILDLTRIEAGAQRLEEEEIALADVIAETVRMMEPAARMARLELIVEASTMMPKLYADRRATKQIVINLLSNAIKFTGPGGHVTLRADATSHGLCLEVSDTGIGIPEDALPRLGQPFQRVLDASQRGLGGVGLGLAVSRGLAELHGGTLKIESMEGKGTTVRVVFPTSRTVLGVAA